LLAPGYKEKVLFWKKRIDSVVMKNCKFIPKLFLCFVFLSLANPVGSYAYHPSNSNSYKYDRTVVGDDSTGLGIMLGAPTGLTLKHWFSDSNALDFGLAYAFADYFALIGDYLWHFRSAFGGKNGHHLVPYLGIGGALFFNTYNGAYVNQGLFQQNWGSSVAFAVRIPLGMEYLINKPPLGIFAELVPGLGVVPATFGLFQGDIGARFYF